MNNRVKVVKRGEIISSNEAVFPVDRVADVQGIYKCLHIPQRDHDQDARRHEDGSKKQATNL